MDPRLLDLMRTVTASGGPATETGPGSYTHLTVYGPHQKWTVRPPSIGALWTGYCDLLQENPTGLYGLAERPADVMPVTAVFTFRFHIEGMKDEPFTDDLIYTVAYCYQQALNDLFPISDNNCELYCCVLESETMWEEKTEKAGGPPEVYRLTSLKLQFPYCRVESAVQTKLVHPRAIQNLRNHNAVAKLAQGAIGDWGQIIKTTAVTEPFLFFGSEVNSERPRMQFNYVLDVIPHPDEWDPEQENFGITRMNLQDVFYPHNHVHVQQGLLPIAHDKPLEYWLPLLLSHGYWPHLCEPKTNATAPINPTPTPLKFGTTQGPEETMLEIADRLLQMLNPDRFLKENFWLDIGKALYNLDGDTLGSDAALGLWRRYTEKYHAAVPDPAFIRKGAEDCRVAFEGFHNTSITIKTLMWYAREDNRKTYDEWHDRWCLASMEKAVTGFHTDVARALYRVYCLDFMCCSLKNPRWYVYKHHRWIEDDQGVTLRKIMSDDFLRKFEALRSSLSKQIQDSNDDGFRTNGEANMKKITNLIGKLKTVAYKSNIMREATESFVNQRFLELLDTNADLLGMHDGVIEILGTQALPRKGKPEDFVSRSTGVSYRAEYDWKHPQVEELMKWFRMVFTDQALLHHWLKFAASCLKGGNADKMFPVWTGDRDNSKSMIVKLFECAFGAYCINFPLSLLTGKRTGSSAPTPELARARAARIAFLKEPDPQETMKGGTIKEFTGGDTFFARMLNENGGDIKATFKMILMCNKVPAIPTADKAVKQRTRIFPFLSTWGDNAPEDEAEQFKQRLFKKDPFFDRKIPKWAGAFMWILVQYFPHYIAEGLPDPPIVKEHTEEYWKNNDVYGQFTTECIEPALNPAGEPDMHARVTLAEVYAEFKSWYRDNYGGGTGPENKMPDRGIVLGELTSRWGRMHGAPSAWSGIRIIQEAANVGATAAFLGGGPKLKVARI